MKNDPKIGNPIDFGAVYDGKTDCSSAINQCLKEYSHIALYGNGTALISSPIMLNSGNWLELDPGFTVKLADTANCEMLKNQWAESAYFSEKNGHPEFMSEIYPGFDPKEWVMGKADKNIKITGGTFDGNGQNQEREGWRYGSMGYCGSAMIFVNLENFEMSNVTIYNPHAYCAEFHIIKYFRLNNIHLDFDWENKRLNIDGLHFGGDCYNGVIDGVTGKTYDDMIALNGGDSWCPKPSKDGTILPQADKVWYPFANGKIANIEIRSIMADNGYRAVRLLSNVKTADSPENETEGMDNILIDGIYGSFNVNSVLISSHIGEEKSYGNITIRNIKNTLSHEERSLGNIKVEPGTFINNLLIHDYYLTGMKRLEALKLDGRIKSLVIRDMLVEAESFGDIKVIETGGCGKEIKHAILDNVRVIDHKGCSHFENMRLKNVKEVVNRKMNEQE